MSCVRELCRRQQCLVHHRRQLVLHPRDAAATRHAPSSSWKALDVLRELEHALEDELVERAESCLALHRVVVRAQLRRDAVDRATCVMVHGLQLLAVGVGDVGVPRLAAVEQRVEHEAVVEHAQHLHRRVVAHRMQRLQSVLDPRDDVVDVLVELVVLRELDPQNFHRAHLLRVAVNGGARHNVMVAAVERWLASRDA